MHTAGQLATIDSSAEEGAAVRITAEPEFCPNSSCRFHDRSSAAEYQWYIRYGSFHTRCRGTWWRSGEARCGRPATTISAPLSKY